MEIHLELFAPLDKYYPAGASRRPYRMTVAEGATARKIVASLNLPKEMNVLVYVNEKQISKDEDRNLEDGDRLGVVPAMPGG